MSIQTYGDGDKTTGSAIQQLDDVKMTTKKAITKAEADGVPPYRMVVNQNPPTGRDIRGDFTPPGWAKTLRFAHAAVLAYWSEIRPFRRHAPDLWTEDLAELEHPVEGEWQSQERRNMPNAEVRPLDHRDITLSLDSLGHFRSTQVPVSARENRRRGGSEVEIRAEKVYLPMVGIHAAYNQINDIRKHVGLTVDVGAGDRPAEDGSAPWETDG